MYLLLLINFFIPGSIYSEESPKELQVMLTSNEFFEIEPKRIVSGSFLVSNNSNIEDKFFDEVELPSGWQLIIPKDIFFSLKPKEKQVRLVSFFVPISTPAGRYKINYRVRSQSAYEITDSDSFSIEVIPLVKLEIIIEDKPDMVISGEVYQIKLRVVNRGNSQSIIKLIIKSHPDYPRRIEPNEVTLESGSSQVITIDVMTEEKIKRRFTHVLNIKAVTEYARRGQEKKDIIFDEKSVSVKIMPKMTGEFDPYHRLPVKVKFISESEDEKSAYQIEVSGDGGLDENNKRNLEFLFRVPDIRDESIYAKREEYFIAYEDKERKYDISLGDRNYSLSDLTEKYRYGRGAEFNLAGTNFKSGFFIVKSRWEEPEETEKAIYLSHNLNDDIQLKGNVLNINKYPNEDNVISIESRIKIKGKLDIDFELADYRRDKEIKSRDKAYRIGINSIASEDIVFSFEKIYAGTDYYGYFNDIDNTYGKVVFPIYKELTGNLLYVNFINNLDFNTDKSSALKENVYSGGVYYPFPFNTDATLDFKYLSRVDRLSPASYDFVEKTLKIGLKNYFKKISIHTYLEKGIYEDNKEDFTNNALERYTIQTYYRPTSKQTYGINAKIGHETFIDNIDRIKAVGFSGSWRFTEDMFLNIDYRLNNIDTDINEENENATSTFSYTLPNNNIIYLSANWTNYKKRNFDKKFISINYTIPLNIPVSRKKSVGMLVGKVYDGDFINKSPIPNVLLSIHNATAVTDEKGEFIFPSLKPGNYHLWVEKIFIGLDRVTTEKLPIQIEIKSGEVTNIEIGIVNSCRIFGRVAIFSLNSEKIEQTQKNAPDGIFLEGSSHRSSIGLNLEETKEVKGLSNILVQLTNGNEKIVVRTDSNGDFYFRDLRPGIWKIKIFNLNIPEYHYIENDEFDLNLKSGEEKEIAFKVLPRRRKIKIIEEGEIKQEKQ